MKILGIIPARYASTRFPAKPLVDIAGKTMIQRVYEQVKKCSLINDVVVATDNEKIFEHVSSFSGKVVMTKESHVSGTDRCFEALTLQQETFNYVVNIQGDEPFIQPEQISLICSLLDGTTEIATLVKGIDSNEMIFNPNVVKALKNKNSEAIYFSRSPVPYLRNVSEEKWAASHTFYKHIGMYAYRSDILKEITKLSPSTLEKAESLEQLRWIENGYKIKIAETSTESLGIDTPDDLQKALAMLRN